jgi:hypothetical protein
MNSGARSPYKMPTIADADCVMRREVHSRTHNDYYSGREAKRHGHEKKRPDGDHGE